MIARTKTASKEPALTNPHGFKARSVFGGFVSAVLASMCCLPGAVAVALGASVGTSAALFRLQDFQRIAQIAGIALALGLSWRLVRRSRKTCSVADHRRNQNRVPFIVLGSFAAVFVILNQVVIRLLERG